jgi:epoxyqueuosine reductase
LRRAWKDAIAAEAGRQGFDACGVAEALPIDPGDRLGQWLEAGHHADMAWMEATRHARQDPHAKLPGTRSVVVCLKHYHHPRPEKAGGTGRVSCYAWGRDYHRALHKPIRRLAAFIRGLNEGAETYCSVDAGPVMEKAWAARAGIGWQGRNSLILRPGEGSYFFLAVIYTTLPLPPDRPMADHCGTCRACIDACPTGAILEEGVVDARRCISYLTIENRGDIPEALGRRMGDWVFGCDICQEVCPHNRPPTGADPDFAPRPGQAHPHLDSLLTMDENRFRALFAGTPLMRAKLRGMQRNAEVVKRNQAGPTHD